jgi:hypothetical protein
MKIVIEHLCWIFSIEIAMKYVSQVISNGIVDRRKKINKYLIDNYYTDRFVKDHWSIIKNKLCEYLIGILIHQQTLNPQ